MSKKKSWKTQMMQKFSKLKSFDLTFCSDFFLTRKLLRLFYMKKSECNTQHHCFIMTFDFIIFFCLMSRRPSTFRLLFLSFCFCRVYLLNYTFFQDKIVRRNVLEIMGNLSLVGRQLRWHFNHEEASQFVLQV